MIVYKYIGGKIGNGWDIYGRIEDTGSITVYNSGHIAHNITPHTKKGITDGELIVYEDKEIEDIFNRIDLLL